MSRKAKNSATTLVKSSPKVEEIVEENVPADSINVNFPKRFPQRYWQLVLFMIVGNENKMCRKGEEEIPLIIRMLRSISPYLSGVCICPNQNRETQDLIAKYCEEQKIPYALIRKTWKSFGHNRTESYTEAVKFMKMADLDRKRTYLLTMDADMELVDADLYSSTSIGSTGVKQDSSSSIGNGGDKSFQELLSRKENLGSIGYTLIQKFHSGLFNPNMRMMRGDSPSWKCVRRTHEYWDNPTKETTDQLTRPYIFDHDDGGTKENKFIRDYGLLKEDVAELNDSRSYFYLGNTCHSLYKINSDKAKEKGVKDEDKQNFTDLADKYLKECISSYQEVITRWYKDYSAWHQEVYMSMYNLTRVYLGLGDELAATQWAVKAYTIDKERAETFYLLTEYYRNKSKAGHEGDGDRQLAYDYAMKGKKIPLPKGNKLFLDTAVYEWKFDHELNILAYYMPEARVDGVKAADRVLVSSAPSHIKHHVWHNVAKFYISVMPKDKRSFTPLSFPFWSSLDGSGHYRPCNPSLLTLDSPFSVSADSAETEKDKTAYYLLNLRMVNYSTTFRNGHYDYVDDDGKTRTRNLLKFLNANYQSVKEIELVDKVGGEHPDSWILGIEDIRLISFSPSLGDSTKEGEKGPNGEKYQLRAVGTCFMTTNRPQQVLLFGEVDLKEGVATIYRKMPMPSPNNTLEKNWIPLSSQIITKTKDEFYFIYYHYPWQVITFNPENNKLTSTPGLKGLPLSKERGSTPPVIISGEKERFIGLTHNVFYEENHGNHSRFYHHRWIEYGYTKQGFVPIRASVPFCFKVKQIEFACGLAVSQDKTKLVVSLGIGDRDACLALVDLDYVMSLLQD